MTTKKQVTRLEDLLVEEVSIVDKPANKRPFLLVKSAGAEVVDDGKGNLTAPTTEPVDKSKPATEPAKTAPAATPSKPKEKTVKEIPAEIAAQVEKTLVHLEKGLAIAPEVRRGIFQGLGEACRRLNAVMNLADAAPTDYEGVDSSSLAPLFAKEMGEVSTLLAGVGKMLGAVSKSDPGPGEDDPDAAEKAMAALVDGLEEKIAKRGAKMSSARLSKFKEALGLLHKLMEELDTVTQNDPGKGRTTKDEDGGEVVQKALETATGAIERLSTTVKKQARQIHDLKTARPAGNAVPAETTPVRKNADDEVRWPRDLNAPARDV